MISIRQIVLSALVICPVFNHAYASCSDYSEERFKRCIRNGDVSADQCMRYSFEGYPKRCYDTEIKIQSQKEQNERALERANRRRTVSAVGGGNPMGISMASACQDAKRKAQLKASPDEEVKSYSSCDCTRDENLDKEVPWSCSVDARLGKR